MMTRKQLERFIKARNKSGFTSNLQFMIDCEEAGFKLEDLGEVKKIDDGHHEWTTPFGVLTEKYARLSLA